MREQAHIDVFIDGLSRYFNHIDSSGNKGRSELEISAPYLLKNTQVMGLDFTGMITVSGRSIGNIFVTANSALLKRILLIYGEVELGVRHKRDLIGEIANTLAGNARQHLGTDFHISTPHVFEGPLETDKHQLGVRSYVLPFRWKSSKAELIVSIKDHGDL